MNVSTVLKSVLPDWEIHDVDGRTRSAVSNNFEAKPFNRRGFSLIITPLEPFYLYMSLGLKFYGALCHFIPD
jgi:hypothetical protein